MVFGMYFLPLHVKETYDSLRHIQTLKTPWERALKSEKFSKKTSQSYRSKPGAEASQLTVLFSRSDLQKDIKNHQRATKEKVKENPNSCINCQFKDNTLAEGPMNL